MPVWVTSHRPSDGAVCYLSFLHRKHTFILYSSKTLEWMRRRRRETKDYLLSDATLIKSWQSQRERENEKERGRERQKERSLMLSADSG